MFLLYIVFLLVFKNLILEMCDNLDVFISDEEEPQPKSRKTKSQKPKPRIIRRSNFLQVSNKINEKNYKKWINQNFQKIYKFFEKVINIFVKNKLSFYLIFFRRNQKMLKNRKWGKSSIDIWKVSIRAGTIW